jgi:hypothetical protein
VTYFASGPVLSSTDSKIRPDSCHQRAEVWWYTPAMPAIWEAEARGSLSLMSVLAKVAERPYLKDKIKTKILGVES